MPQKKKRLAKKPKLSMPVHRVDSKKIILHAFEEEHELLESEKMALEQLFSEIREEERLLDNEADSVDGIRKLIQSIEEKEDFLALQVQKKIADPHQRHESYADVKKNFDGLTEALETIKKIHARMDELKNEELHEAVKTAEANWQVVSLLEHAIARAERTKFAVEKLFKDLL